MAAKRSRKGMRAYVLIETAPGKTKAVKKQLARLSGAGSTLAHLDAVTGPYDFIAVVEGPTLRGARLPWRAYAHGGTLTLPDGSASPVQLASFASATPERGPYFVMSAPSFWESTGRTSPNLFTGVFLHEFAHTRQVEGMKDRLGPIDASWQGPEELDDDAVQRRFEKDPEYVAAYTEERDLLYASADAPSIGEARELAARALAKMRARHARWFTGDDAVHLSAVLKDLGCDLIDVSSGQTSVEADPEYGRLYQTPFSDRIRNEVGIATMTVGAVSSIDDVNTILVAGRADLCVLARPHLVDPYWTLNAAIDQGYTGHSFPPQYLSGLAARRREQQPIPPDIFRQR